MDNDRLYGLYSTEDLIRLRWAGNFGLAQWHWFKQLDQIRELPETYERNYPHIPYEPGEEE